MGHVAKSRRWNPVFAGVLGALLGLAVSWTMLGRGGSSAGRPPRPALLAIRMPAGVATATESNTGQTQVLAISRDGRSVAFVGSAEGQQRIFLRRVEEKEFREIQGSGSGSSPFFSPDGAWLAFFADGKLRKAALAGGDPIVLCDASLDRGGVWLPDGTIVFSPDAFSAAPR